MVGGLFYLTQIQDQVSQIIAIVKWKVGMKINRKRRERFIHYLKLLQRGYKVPVQRESENTIKHKVNFSTRAQLKHTCASRNDRIDTN